jgi:hypothetical protein
VRRHSPNPTTPGTPPARDNRREPHPAERDGFNDQPLILADRPILAFGEQRVDMSPHRRIDDVGRNRFDVDALLEMSMPPSLATTSATPASIERGSRTSTWTAVPLPPSSPASFWANSISTSATARCAPSAA